MDDRRFDSLTKAIGMRTSRRSLLRGAIGALVAGVTGAVIGSERARAATPKRPRTCIQAGRTCGPPSSGPSRNCCYKCNAATGTCCETVRYGCAVDGDCCGTLICRDAIAGDTNPQRTCFQPGTLPAGAECRAAAECASGGCAGGRCCTPENATCTANSQCCAGNVCRGGTCRPRGGAGEICDEQGDCLPGYGCSNKTCCATNQTACTANSQCCTGLVCRGGLCQVRGTTGQTCDENADCQSNACDPNRHTCCQPGGRTCTTNSQCCSGMVCRAGVCQAPGAIGQICDEPADCVSGSCDPTRRVCCTVGGGTCSANSHCCGGNVCRGGTCRPAGGQGATCDEAADCQAGYGCQSAVCCAQQNTTCSANAHCCSGLVCRGGTCRPPGTGGQVCDEDADCAAGTCNNGVCCVGAAATCTANSQCCSGLVCRGGTCQAPGSLGQTCDEAADCSTGACDGARRICCLPSAQACAANADCCDGLVCRGGTCQALGATGQTCDEGVDCVSGACHASNNVCCQPQSQTCSANAQCCAGLVCRGGSCLPPGNGGDICDEDADCAVGTCNEGTCCLPSTSACTTNSQCCAGMVCRDGICQAPGTLGQTCDEAADCITGYACESGQCCAGDSTSCAANGACCSGLTCINGSCAQIAGLGDACDDDNDCTSGTCTSGVCCLAENDPCTDNSHCCAGLVCRNGLCLAPGGQDDTCDETADCAAGYLCESLACCAGATTACLTNGDCCSGLTCIGGACAEPSGLDGTCDADDDCISGYLCESGSCCAAATTACSADDDCCQGLACDEGVCAAVPPPVANPDTYWTPFDTPLNVSAANGVLANDTTPAGTLSVTAFDATSSEGGTVVVAADGSFTYTPDAGFIGEDAFSYTVSGPGGDDIGTATVIVSSDFQYVGEIRLMAFVNPPKNWAPCNGQLLPIAQYQELFALLGTTFGGDGRVNFALPDLRDRVPIHVGAGHVRGEQAGVQNLTLITSELPAHTHAVMGTNDAADVAVPGGNLPAQATAQIYNGASAPLASLHAASVTAAGSSQAHLNMQPFLTVSFCIALYGTYPVEAS